MRDTKGGGWGGERERERGEAEWNGKVEARKEGRKGEVSGGRRPSPGMKRTALTALGSQQRVPQFPRPR